MQRALDPRASVQPQLGPRSALRRLAPRRRVIASPRRRDKATFCAPRSAARRAARWASGRAAWPLSLEPGPGVRDARSGPVAAADLGNLLPVPPLATLNHAYLCRCAARRPLQWVQDAARLTRRMRARRRTGPFRRGCRRSG